MSLYKLSEFMPEGSQYIEPSGVMIDPKLIAGITCEGRFRDRILKIYFKEGSPIFVRFYYREEHSDDTYLTAEAIRKASLYYPEY